MGKVDVIEALEGHREYIRTSDPHIDTPLYFAAVCDSVSGIDFLVEAGADVNVKEHRQEKKPLH